MDINTNDVSVVQLKRWLDALGLPTRGCKAELVARINALPASDRGNIPEAEQTGEEEMAENDMASQEEELPRQLMEISTVSMQQSAIDRQEEILQQLTAQLETAKNLLQNLRTPTVGAIQQQQLEQDDNSFRNETSVGGANAELVERTSVARIGDAETDGEIGADVSNTAAGPPILQNCELTSSLFSLAKEVLDEFSGEKSINNWISQLDNISKLYRLSDVQKELLCMVKLKGKAREWLHADPSRIVMSLGELLEQLRIVFGGKLSKTDMRRKFEERTWKVSEKFALYYESKCQLARDVRLDEDELLDGLIEGIPDLQLRTQAKIQCFENPSKLMRAFAGVCLPEQGLPNGKNGSSAGATPSSLMKETRCFNCNYKGHWAKDCWKPKREPGSCYACGATDHLVAKCPKRKTMADNNYNAS